MPRPFSTFASMVCAALLAGCVSAPPQPLPFDLVGKGNVQYHGQFNPADMSVSVVIGNKPYTGFYLTSTTTAHSTDMGGYPGFHPYRYGLMDGWPRDVWTTISNNIGKAYLKSTDGDGLACDFMFENRRLLGVCHTLQDGTTYQMVADPAPANQTNRAN